MHYIYLAGPVSGRPEQEYLSHFDRVADEIRRKTKGMDIAPFNPVRFCRDGRQIPQDAPWHLFLRACIPHLADSDGIGLLQGWEKSRGARMELFVAQELKIPVVYFEPPVDDFSLALFHSNGHIDELYRYFHQRVISNLRQQEGIAHMEINPQGAFGHGHDPHLDIATDRAVFETANRYLDPHGFEYLDEPSKEEPYGQV
jgi:hypothetical protein